MKIAVAGKGGTGKTLVTSLLARQFAGQGRPVLAIDADPSPGLGVALGFPEAVVADLRPIADMKALIAERTGVKRVDTGGYFKLNPKVDDLPDRFTAEHDGVRLLLLGAIERGGSGCICPGSALLRQLVNHVLLARDEVVLMDLYAGVEHLGRATAEAVDAMLVVTEPTRQSVATARQISDLARDIRIDRLYFVANKVRDDGDREFLDGQVDPEATIARLPFSSQLWRGDQTGVATAGADPALQVHAASLVAQLEELVDS